MLDPVANFLARFTFGVAEAGELRLDDVFVLSAGDDTPGLSYRPCP